MQRFFENLDTRHGAERYLELAAACLENGDLSTATLNYQAAGYDFRDANNRTDSDCRRAMGCEQECVKLMLQLANDSTLSANERYTWLSNVNDACARGMGYFNLMKEPNQDDDALNHEFAHHAKLANAQLAHVAKQDLSRQFSPTIMSMLMK